MTWQTRLDCAIAFLIGMSILLFLHADHLIATYTGFDDPTWRWHLLVDSGYLVWYSMAAFVAIRGWRVMQRRRRQRDREEE